MVLWGSLPLPSRKKIWTDGSCVDSENFWLCKGACAAFDDLGHCLFQTPVHHLALSSYSCELWAIIQAFCRSQGPCKCRSDSESVVSQVKYMMFHLHIPSTWLHFEWWIFFLQIYLQRLGMHSCPLIVTWIPSHKLEHIPCFEISNAPAESVGSSWEDISGNRMADKFAKQAIGLFHPSSSQVPSKASIIDWQVWLALVNSKLGELSNQDKCVKIPNCGYGSLDDDSHASKIPKVTCVPSDLTIKHAVESFQEILPKWGWKQTDYNFDWFPSFPKEIALSSYAKISPSNCNTALAFLHGLSWDSGPNLKLKRPISS